ncbi:MAG: sporulation protein YabP [Eubacteriaceae bacterium]|nr:sporulation protein YabP [Eubacteriaceae bacterium]
MDNARGEHKIELFSRGELNLTGVIDVHSFNDEGILLETIQGILTVGGSDLRITSLDLQSGRVSMKGQINMLLYNDEAPQQKGKGLLSRLFK